MHEEYSNKLGEAARLLGRVREHLKRAQEMSSHDAESEQAWEQIYGEFRSQRDLLQALQASRARCREKLAEMGVPINEHHARVGKAIKDLVFP